MERQLIHRHFKIGMSFRVEMKRFPILVGASPVLRLVGKRQHARFHADMMQLLRDDRVVFPIDESIVFRLILQNPEFCIHIVLHLMVVTVEMVRRDIQNHSDVSLEVIHVVELETAQLHDIHIVFLRSHLQRKARPHIAGKTYVEARILQNVIGEHRCCRLAVAAGDANHFRIRIATGQFNFRNDGNAFRFYFLHNRRRLRNPRAFHHFVGI